MSAPTHLAKKQLHRTHRRKVKQCLKTPPTRPMKKGYRMWLQATLDDAKRRPCPSDTPAGGFSPKGIALPKRSHHTKPRKPRQGTPSISAIAQKMAAHQEYALAMDAD